MKPLVVILSDSLGLPRSAPERVEVEHTWPQLLRTALPYATVHQVSLGGATTSELLAQLSYVDGSRIDLLIVQAGIVDCAPRAFSKRELDLLQSFKLGRLVLAALKGRGTRLLRRIRRISYVQPTVFAANVLSLKNAVRCNILWLEIVGSSNYDSLVPGITKSIRLFNRIIAERLGDSYVPLSRLRDQELMEDGHHLNEIGHRKVFETLTERIEHMQLTSQVDQKAAVR